MALKIISSELNGVHFIHKRPEKKRQSIGPVNKKATSFKL